MFCPQCGQERVSEATSFCSRCGFLLTGLIGLLETGGVPASIPLTNENSVSPRSRGIRQGIFMFLLTFVIAPIVGLISQFGLGIEPWPVGLVIFGLGIGGLLRIAYAVMFESKSPVHSPRPALHGDQHFEGQDLFSAPAWGQIPSASAHDTAQSSRSGRLQETNDLQPHSVTDSTTKLLENEVNREG